VRFKRKIRWLMWKAYFDRGFGITSYIKYFIAFFGLASQDISATLILGLLYAFACVIIGWIWFKYKLVDAEIEISNLFNPFCRELRRKVKHKI
jgi:uncharacterized membrane protein YdbT with pleckstrin-like domain